jgi:hemoglobin
MKKSDIKNMDDVKLMVNEFYNKVKENNLLAPIFYEKIKDNWQPHLERMYLFWGAAILGEKGYIGNPFSKHSTLPITFEHFQQWLLLFTETIDRLFEGALAEDAKWRAGIMADNFLRRLNDNKTNNAITIV